MAMLNLEGSRDIGHTLFEKLFVGIGYMKLCTKFKVSASTDFGNI